MDEGLHCFVGQLDDWICPWCLSTWFTTCIKYRDFGNLMVTVNELTCSFQHDILLEWKAAETCRLLVAGCSFATLFLSLVHRSFLTDEWLALYLPAMFNVKASRIMHLCKCNGYVSILLN
jgi:hypothetical protein